MKQETRYIIFSTLYAFVFMGIIVPDFLGKQIDQVNPYLSFLLFNLGIFIFLQIFLKAVVLNSKLHLKEAAGLFFLFMGLDIIVPPLAISTSGQFLTGTLLTNSSSDYFFGLFWNSIGISGFFLYLFVYVVSPAILLFISSKLLKNFVKNI